MKYSMLGPLLLDDIRGTLTEAIIVQCHHDAANINLTILQKWINGGGIQPLMWSTLTKVLKDVGLAELAREIEQNLQKYE